MQPLYLRAASALSASLRWTLSLWLCLHDEEIFRRSSAGQLGYECLDCLHWRPLHPELVEGSPLEKRIRSRQFNADPELLWPWRFFGSGYVGEGLAPSSKETRQ